MTSVRPTPRRGRRGEGLGAGRAGPTSAAGRRPSCCETAGPGSSVVTARRVRPALRLGRTHHGRRKGRGAGRDVPVAPMSGLTAGGGGGGGGGVGGRGRAISTSVGQAARSRLLRPGNDPDRRASESVGRPARISPVSLRGRLRVVCDDSDGPPASGPASQGPSDSEKVAPPLLSESLYDPIGRSLIRAGSRS